MYVGTEKRVKNIKDIKTFPNIVNSPLISSLVKFEL
jgi:hypothetical protein